MGMLTSEGRQIASGQSIESNKRRRPARTATTPQNDCENRVSRNSPSLAVALNCGIGSSSLNADVTGPFQTTIGNPNSS
jgi:hypothetical protein